MRYYDSFLKGPARPSGRAKLQYSATITTPTDILFPTTSAPRGFVCFAAGKKGKESAWAADWRPRRYERRKKKWKMET